MATSPCGAGVLARLRDAVLAPVRLRHDVLALQCAALAARFRLYEDWRRIVRHAWSVRLALLAALLSGAEVVCAVFTDNPPIERGAFAALAGLITIAAAIARLFAQTKLGDDA